MRIFPLLLCILLILHLANCQFFGDEDSIGDNDLRRPSGRSFYRQIPTTNFRCEDQQWAGYYSDPEAQCQVFHICVRRHGTLEQFSFLCPNETVFHQELLVCVWWDSYDCETSSQFYEINKSIFEEDEDGSSEEFSGRDGKSISLTRTTENPIINLTPLAPVSNDDQVEGRGFPNEHSPIPKQNLAAEVGFSNNGRFIVKDKEVTRANTGIPLTPIATTEPTSPPITIAVRKEESTTRPGTNRAKSIKSNRGSFKTSQPTAPLTNSPFLITKPPLNSLRLPTKPKNSFIQNPNKSLKKKPTKQTSFSRQQTFPTTTKQPTTRIRPTSSSRTFPTTKSRKTTANVPSRASIRGRPLAATRSRAKSTFSLRSKTTSTTQSLFTTTRVTPKPTTRLPTTKSRSKTLNSHSQITKAPLQKVPTTTPPRRQKQKTKAPVRTTTFAPRRTSSTGRSLPPIRNPAASLTTKTQTQNIKPQRRPVKTKPKTRNFSSTGKQQTALDILHDLVKNITIIQSRALLKENSRTNVKRKVDHSRFEGLANNHFQTSTYDPVTLKQTKRKPVSSYTSSRGIQRKLYAQQSNKGTSKRKKNLPANKRKNPVTNVKTAPKNSKTELKQESLNPALIQKARIRSAESNNDKPEKLVSCAYYYGSSKRPDCKRVNERAQTLRNLGLTNIAAGERNVVTTGVPLPDAVDTSTAQTTLGLYNAKPSENIKPPKGLYNAEPPALAGLYNAKPSVAALYNSKPTQGLYNSKPSKPIQGLYNSKPPKPTQGLYNSKPIQGLYNSKPPKPTQGLYNSKPTQGLYNSKPKNKINRIVNVPSAFGVPLTLPNLSSGPNSSSIRSKDKTPILIVSREDAEGNGENQKKVYINTIKPHNKIKRKTSSSASSVPATSSYEPIAIGSSVVPEIGVRHKRKTEPNRNSAFETDHESVLEIMNKPVHLGAKTHYLH